MSKFIGRQQEVGIAKEATRGTQVVPTFWVPKVNFAVEDRAIKARFDGNYGVLAGGDDALVAQRWAEGELEVELQDKITGLLFYALFGTLTSASFNSAYKHTLTLQNSVQQTSLSLWLRDPVGTLVYRMAMVNSFDLRVVPDEIVKATFGFIAKAHKDFTAQTPSYTAQNKFSGRHLTVKVAADESSLDAAAKINVQELRIRIAKNVVREPALGTVDPVDILNRKFTISGTLKLTHEDRTYRDYMLNGTKKALRITLANSGVTIGTTNPTIQIDLPVVDFHDWEPSHPLDEITSQEIQFTALYDVANTKLIGTATFVVNETASY
jgi:hypothetical protein